MECKYCGCYWQEPDELFPTCHYEGPHEWSPCEAQEEADRIAREEEEWEQFKRQIEEEYT